jgi:Tfp pilus assembly PilM family ATPase
MSIVAIEINPERILLVAGRKATNRPLEVSHAIEIPLFKDPTDEEIGEKLKEAVSQHGLSRCEAVVVLSRSQSELREIELPPAPDDELPDMVMFKAKSDFASFNDRWLLDYVSLDDDETQPRKVLASAIAPEVSRRVEKIIEPSGLKLKQLVLRPFAIMDLIQQKTSDGKSRLVVNPGDNFTDIVVTKGAQTVSTRSIRIPAGRTADQRSQQLISEVRRTIASSRRQLGTAKIDGLVLLDDEKPNRHLVGNLGERLGIDIDVVNPFDGLHRIGQAKDAIDSPWKFTPLLGSLAHHGSEHVPAIDFLNPTRKEEVVVDRSRYWLYGSFAALAAAATIMFGWLILRQQKADIAHLEQKHIDLLKMNEDNGVEKILGRVGTIDDWEKENVSWLHELDEMSKLFLTADEVMVSRLDAAIRRGGPSIEVAGKIVSTKEDSELFGSLESRPYKVVPNKSERSEDKDYPYTFGSSLMIERRGNAWLKKIDERAKSFKKRLDQDLRKASDSQAADENGEGGLN